MTMGGFNACRGRTYAFPEIFSKKNVSRGFEDLLKNKEEFLY